MKTVARIFTLGVIGCLLLSNEVDAKAKDRKMTIHMVTGEVFYKRGETKVRPVRKTTRLRSSDIIRTMLESRLDIRLEDGTLLTIEENSVVKLAKVVSDGKDTQTRIDVKTGKLLFNVKKLASSRSEFVFETPTATAAIRGTKGGIGTDGKKTYAYLEEGGLELVPRGGKKGVTIKGLEVAVQKDKGFNVKKLANTSNLKKLIQKLEKAVIKVPTLPAKGTVGAVVPSADLFDVNDGKSDDQSKVSDDEKEDEVNLDSLIQEEDIEENLTQDSIVESPKVPEMVLGTLSPQGEEFALGENIVIEGNTTPGAIVQVRNRSVVVSSNGTFKINVKGPVKPGEYTWKVLAEMGTQKIQGEVSFVVAEPEIALEVSVLTPPRNSEWEGDKTLIVQGTTTPGTEIFVNGEVARVSGSIWRYAWVPEESGKQFIRIEAKYKDQQETIEWPVMIVGDEKNVPPLFFKVTSPLANTTISESTFEITGEGTPGAKIEVLGEELIIGEQGLWSIVVNTPDRSGLQLVPIQVIYNDEERSVPLMILVEEKQVVIPLFLNVLVPTPNQELTEATIRIYGKASPGAKVSLLGETLTAAEDGSWELTVETPDTEGEHTLLVEVELGEESLRREIPVRRILEKEPINGTLTASATEVEQPRVTLFGTCNEGARVRVRTYETTVVAGKWSLEVPFADDEQGANELEAFCLYNGEEASIGKVTVTYTKPVVPLTLNLTTPLSVTQVTSSLVVEGTATGDNVQVYVNGSGVVVGADGSFSKPILFNPSNWDMTDIEVKAVSNGTEQVKNIAVTVDKSKTAINTRTPNVSVWNASSSTGKYSYTITDSPGDELEIKKLLNGTVYDTENLVVPATGYITGQLDLQHGNNKYAVQVKDLAERYTERSQYFDYIPHITNLDIEVLEPSVTPKVVRMPPYNPDNSFVPKATVRVRIDNLPGDDHSLLSSVTIRNQNNGQEKRWEQSGITDLEFEYDVPLVKNTTNQIVVIAIPRNGTQATENFTIELR